jgi:hypothetical protein
MLACQINLIVLQYKLTLRTKYLYDCKSVIHERMHCEFRMELLVKIRKSEKRKVYFRRVAQILQKSRSHLKIVGARRVT